MLRSSRWNLMVFHCIYFYFIFRVLLYSYIDIDFLFTFESEFHKDSSALSKFTVDFLVDAF